MYITSSPKIQSFGMTPVTLLTRCAQGEMPVYKHDKNSDTLQTELDILANQYKSDLSINTKKQILIKEREMLFEELKHPELTLARNYKNIITTIPANIKGHEYTDALRLFSLEGLGRNLSTNIMSNVKLSDEEMNTLKEVYSELEETTKTGKDGKKFIIKFFSFLKQKNPDLKNKVSDIYNDFYEITKDEELKDMILSRKSDIDEKKLFEDLKKDPENNNLFRLVLIHSKVNDKEITEHVNNILTSDNVSKNIMRNAVWGAGKFRSDKNFEIIKEIALNKDEKDIRKREFAIHSTALYLQEKPAEVNAIMDEIKGDGTIFSPLATIIKDKINGNYHGQKDRELNYANLSPQEAEDFKKGLENFIIADVTLNTQQKNACQRSMIPFIKYLSYITNYSKDMDENKFILSNDTVTKFDPDCTATRSFFQDRDLSYSGHFEDSVGGVHWSEHKGNHWVNLNLIDLKHVSRATHTNPISHEMGHHIEYEYNLQYDISNLYRNAMKNNLALNDYATTCASEYFAEGVDAYASVYIPHHYLLKSGFNSRYELMDKDPDLYNFIDNLSKYNPKSHEDTLLYGL